MKKLILFASAGFILFSCNEEEEAPKVAPDTVVKGVITNADGNTAWLETFKSEKYSATVNAKGEFEIKVLLKEPTCFDLVNGKAKTYLCLAPGDTVNVSFDAKDIEKTVKYDGKNAKFPNYLADKKRNIDAMMISEFQFLYSLPTDSFLLLAEKSVSKWNTAYDAIKGDTNINKTFIANEEKALKYDRAALFLDYGIWYKKFKMIDSVPGFEKVLETTKDANPANASDLSMESYRNFLNSYININAEKELAADTALKSNPEGAEKAKWLAIEKNIIDSAVKDYLKFNFIIRNSALSFVAEEKNKFKAATKDTVYLKLLK